MMQFGDFSVALVNLGQELKFYFESLCGNLETWNNNMHCMCWLGNNIFFPVTKINFFTDFLILTMHVSDSDAPRVIQQDSSS